MIASTGSVFSWAFWLSWMVIGAGVELFTLAGEKRLGTLPLTRVVRDHGMRGKGLAHIVIRFGVLTFLTWLWIHFVLPIGW